MTCGVIHTHCMATITQEGFWPLCLFPNSSNKQKRELMKDQAVLESFKTQWLLNCLCALRCAEGRSIRWASPASAGAADRHGQMGCLPGTKPKDAEYLRVVWPLAVSCGSRRNQDAGIWVFVSGTLLGKCRGQPQDDPKSLILFTLGAGARQETRRHRPSWLRGPEDPRLPCREPALAGGPIPSRPGHRTAPSRLQAPRTPVRAPSGAGRWATVAAAAHRELGGFFPYFFPPFPHLRAAHCPHCSW